MTRILGIDPGSRITGYAVIDSKGLDASYCTSGCIRAGDTPFPMRLKCIFDGLRSVIAEQSPDELSIEQVFMQRNASSALKLGHARGVAVIAGALDDLPIFEYSANQIKQAVVGQGHASKEQIQHMIRHLLSLDRTPQEDAADALAVALCHGHTRHTTSRLEAGRYAGRVRRR